MYHKHRILIKINKCTTFDKKKLLFKSSVIYNIENNITSNINHGYNL